MDFRDEDGYRVFPRIVRNYASRNFVTYEKEVASIATLTEYAEFVRKKKVFCETVLQQLGKGLDDDDLRFGVYAWLMPMKDIFTFKVPTLDVLNAMACTWRFGKGKSHTYTSNSSIILIFYVYFILGTESRAHKGIDTYMKKAESTITFDDTSANMAAKYGKEIERIDLLRYAPSQLALCLEGAMISAVGLENCTNMNIPGHKLKTYRPHIIDQLAFYQLHNSIYDYYEELRIIDAVTFSQI